MHADEMFCSTHTRTHARTHVHTHAFICVHYVCDTLGSTPPLCLLHRNTAGMCQTLVMFQRLWRRKCSKGCPGSQTSTLGRSCNRLRHPCLDWTSRNWKVWIRARRRRRRRRLQCQTRCRQCQQLHLLEQQHPRHRALRHRLHHPVPPHPRPHLRLWAPRHQVAVHLHHRRRRRRQDLRRRWVEVLRRRRRRQDHHHHSVLVRRRRRQDRRRHLVHRRRLVRRRGLH